MLCPKCGEKLPVGFRGAGNPINVCPECASGFRIHMPIWGRLVNFFVLISTIFAVSVFSQDWGQGRVLIWLLACFVVMVVSKLVFHALAIPKLVIPRNPTVLASFQTTSDGDVQLKPDMEEEIGDTHSSSQPPVSRV